MTRTEKIVNRIVLLLGLGMIAYYLALGVFVRFGQSLQWLWLLGGVACILRWFRWRRIDRTGVRPPRRRMIALRSVVAACVAIFLIAECVILGNGVMAPKQNLDAIIVLGARVNGREPSGALRNRIQVAAEYLQANPDTIVIVSGGQGVDEEISEAQCMYENLVALGIDPDRIIMEDQSTDTAENLHFSKALLPEGVETVGVVTNNFHIFRALAIARGTGFENVHGIPVATSLLSLPHYLMREFAGVVVDGLKGNLAF